jgi:hypothetical protein
MKPKNVNRLKKQKGVALIVALLGLVLLAAIGVGLMFMADTENSINNNYRDAQKAYFAARAGAEDVRLMLAPGGVLNAQAQALTMPSSALATGVIYVMNSNPPTAIDPRTGPDVAANPSLDNELCQEQFVGLVGLFAMQGPCAGAGHLPPSSSYFSSPALTSADIPGLGSANALPFKWVRVTNKQNLMGLTGLPGSPSPTQPPQSVSNAVGTTPGQQVCWNGTQELPLPAGTLSCKSMTPEATPVWLLTSLAVTPPLGANPGSRRMVQMEVALNPPLNAPAPISTQAPVNLQGSFVLNAYDNCTCTCTTTTTSTGNGNNNKVTSCVARQPLVASCNGQAHAVYTGGTVSVTGGAGQTTTAYGSDPTQGASVQNVNPWPYNIDDLINQYKAGASSPGYSCTGTQNFFATPPAYLQCGIQTSQTFGTYPSGLPDTEPDPTTLNSVTEYIPGSVKLTSAASGSGILIVDGDLEINGGLNWYGLILVRGQVSFTGGAGQNVNLYGSILAGQDVNATDLAQTDTFGGSINFNYDVCAMKNLGGPRPPRMLASHELMF